jgi:hypothetical protein
VSLKKLTVLKFIAVQALLVSSAYSNEVSRSEFLKQVSKVVGNYETVGEAKRYCDPGGLAFVDEKNPEKGLRLSGKLYFGPFAESVSTSKEEGYCSITEKFQYTASSVKQVTKVHDCKKEHKKDENVSTQTLQFKNNKLIYKSLESKIECVFEKSTKGGDV